VSRIALFSLFFLTVYVYLSACAGPATLSKPLPPTPPVAHILSIEPVQAFEGDEIKFNGGGESPGGKITAYRWTSALDGFLSDHPGFNSKSLSNGKHKIFFAVRDEKGIWAEDDTGDVTIYPRIPPPIIDFFTGDPRQIGLAENATLSWHVSGATMISLDNGIGAVGDSGKLVVSPGISTQYTLVATNAGGSSSSAVDVIVVPVRNMNLPVIRTFAPDPGGIAPGDNATLKWNVDYASSVQIDPGIGFREPSGSVRISPAATTKYTLTAYSSVGIVIGTTQIVVGQSSGPGRADLVLADIYKVISSDGVRIGITIENRGTQASPSAESRLFANGLYRDVTSIPIIKPGASFEGLFDKWKYDPSLNIVEVQADAGNNVIESNKANNILKTVFPVVVEYDFFENAKLAQWNNGFQPIIFGTFPDSIDGAALYRTDKRLENATGPAKYLETRPRSTFSGIITGDYPSIEVKPGDYFSAIVGLLEGADAGNVTFEVYAGSIVTGEWTLLGDGVNAIYDYKLRSVNLPVPPSFYGKKTDFRLKVFNNGEPLQNWAVWVKARLVR
jgi:hypothetical protein